MNNERTCANCACIFIIERPALQPPGMSAADFDATPPKQYVCRLNPPIVVATPKGRALMQMPTGPDLVCWQWRPDGCLPGNVGV